MNNERNTDIIENEELVEDIVAEENLDIEENNNSEDTYNEHIEEIEDTNVEEKKSKGKLETILVAGVSAMIGAGFSVSLIDEIADRNIVSAPIVANTENLKGTEKMNVYEAVYKKVSPSVVGILTTSLNSDNIFSIPVENSGVGTGVIVDSRGYILTNAHVVPTEGQSLINVVLNDGTSQVGNVIWSDTSLDLAIVKVNGNGYVAAELGDSDKVNVGSIAIAIGNPISMEYRSTITQGIISGINRSVKGADFSMEGLLQTDASVNPGNSGGPLLNERGQVIGINTAKTNDSEGIGLAIPVNIVKPIVEQVIENGTYEKVMLGIKGMSLTAFKSLIGADLEIEEGVYVAEVEENTPAKKSGMKVGDVIVGINGVSITDMNSLAKELYKYKQNEWCDVEVFRSGEKIKLKVMFTKIKE